LGGRREEKRSILMTTTEYPMVVGVFRDHTRAAQAINELHSVGFRDDKIRVGKAATASGLLDNLACRWTGFDAESRTLPDELVDKGMSPDEANYYQQEFEAGHSVVIVEAYGHQQEARDILRRYGAYDASQAGTHHNPYEQTEGDRTIPVREEVLQTHKHLIETGEVVVRKEVITEEKTITVPVRREELVIERRPTSPQSPDQPVPEGKILDETLKDGKTLKIVLHEEQVHVEKYPVVKEEVFISKRQIEETKPFSDTLKREEVRIERVGKVHIQGNDQDVVS
jgi:uncharacterized protein (TIGR02271 family)